MLYLTWFILPLLAGAVRRGTKIVLTNDDGWAVAQIRAPSMPCQIRFLLEKRE